MRKRHASQYANFGSLRKELISGKKIDLTKNMTVGARQSLIIEL